MSNVVKHKTRYKLYFYKNVPPALFVCAHVLFTFNFCLPQTTDSGIGGSGFQP